MAISATDDAACSLNVRVELDVEFRPAIVYQSLHDQNPVCILVLIDSAIQTSSPPSCLPALPSFLGSLLRGCCCSLVFLPACYPWHAICADVSPNFRQKYLLLASKARLLCVANFEEGGGRGDTVSMEVRSLL